MKLDYWALAFRWGSHRVVGNIKIPPRLFHYQSYEIFWIQWYQMYSKKNKIYPYHIIYFCNGDAHMIFIKEKREQYEDHLGYLSFSVFNYSNYCTILCTHTVLYWIMVKKATNFKWPAVLYPHCMYIQYSFASWDVEWWEFFDSTPYLKVRTQSKNFLIL